MKQLYQRRRRITILALLLVCFGYSHVFAQTAFINPVTTTQTGASTSYTSIVTAPETVNPGNGCGETGANWTHNFLGTSNKRLTGFTITSTNYYVNNFGSLTTVMRRNNSSGAVNAASCGAPLPAIPWHDRQIAFYEGTEDTVANVANIVASYPSTTTPGSAGYGSILDMNLVFSRGFINSGADNIFNNMSGTGSGYNSNANNIERMDLFVSGGVNVTAANMNKTGIVIVCRGPADDPFVLSAIKGLTGGSNTGGGSTYIYDDIIKVNATWTTKNINGGAGVAIAAGCRVTLIASLNAVVTRRIDGDGSLNDQLLSTSYPIVSSYVTGGTNAIVAMFFTFADLGLTAGEVFYGYSVSGYDVTATTSTQFNSYLNSAIFPLTTDPANGGVDLTGFPGLFSPVDIDDDDDGLPDYLELNQSLAFGDADADGILNYCDATYAGYIDNNTDNINDNFDPSADSDNDGIPNYRDNTFLTWGWTDSNSDGVNDVFDWDLDGVPNHLDRDSDNDGIPDVVESFGVDANGDGVIDNYTDTDVDGFSQNVDFNNTGALNSGKGLDNIDTDSDGVPNYLDSDSDNDGIPDVVEVYGTDANNNAIIDGFIDSDGDGFVDGYDGDVGNDNVAENSSNAFLRTGSDANSDGRTDSWPYNNMDSDGKPNPYDLDADGDGITDVKEAQFSDTDWNGKVDGAYNSKGWSTVIAALPSLGLPNTDGTGKTNLFDIDSDDDGIPDNVEGLTTAGYILPNTTDTDGDGIIDLYDNSASYGGDGIHVCDTDGDTVPDYLDSDTDGDGKIDRIEGNDYNLNAKADDNVTLTGLDTDADGLDNRFDANNSSTEGTSAYMGNGGSVSGDATPGSNTMVQHTTVAGGFGCATERDWRCVFYVLKCNLLSFTATLQQSNVQLNWTAYCEQNVDQFVVMRSTDGLHFTDIINVPGRPVINAAENYQANDNISGLQSEIFYYRLRSEYTNGNSGLTNIIAIRNKSVNAAVVELSPNPARDHLQVMVYSSGTALATLTVIDAGGKMLYRGSQLLQAGNNSFTYNGIVDLPPGIYYLRLNTAQSVWTSRFSVIK